MTSKTTTSSDACCDADSTQTEVHMAEYQRRTKFTSKR
jgi:hypothetical protein